MHLEATLKSFIYLIASSMFVPALILLCLIIAWMLFYSGLFFSEWLERARRPKLKPEKLNPPYKSEHLEPYLAPPVRAYGRRLTELFHHRDKTVEAEFENILQEESLALWKSLDRVKMVIRVGPGLGLIGTLVPMGTGLVALGQGDITKLSSDLVIAFTTTVVGLASGMAAYFFYTIKRRWVEEDIRNIEFLTEVLVQGRKVSEIHEIHVQEENRPELRIGRQ